MKDPRIGPVHFGDINAPVNLGTLGSNVAFGNGAILIQGPVSPELIDAINRRVDGMATLLAEMAHREKLQQRQVELLAADLARIKRALNAPEPDQGGFAAAAGDLWNKLMMIGNTVQGVSGLAEGLSFIAKTLGWTLALPAL